MMSEKEEPEGGDRIKLNDLEAPSDHRSEGLEEEREKWTSHLEYILSMVGYSVGLGNLWRFPYVCNRNGGGAFLIPYFLFLIITGFPMFSLESALGQFSGKNSVEIWSFCPILKGTGVGGIIINALYVPIYGFSLAWPIYYMVKSCSSVLPWTTCTNSWNTPLCAEDVTNNSFVSMSGNSSDVISIAELWKNKSLAHTSVEEFWQYNVLNVSNGIDEIGSVQWHIVGCLFAGYLIVFLCLSRGVKSVGKVVYVTAILPYILLIIIFIRTMVQPGAVDGVLYYVQPDFSRLLTVQVWLEACLQVFFSLGPGWGILPTTASHNKFHEPCLRDSVIVAAVSEGTSVLAGFVTFSVLGVMAERLSVPIPDVVSSGPGLGFVAYPEALAQLPLPQLWSFLFFLMLVSVGLDSQFVALESVHIVIIDRFPQLFFKRRLLILAAMCLLYFLSGVIFCTQGGPYILQIVDWYVASMTAFVVCLLECIATTWIYGIKQLNRDIEMMLGKPIPTLIRLLWAVTTPVVLLAAFILTLTRYQPPTYGKYTYPDYAIVMGWVVATISLIPLPVFAFISVRKHMDSNSIRKAIASASRPDRNWRPALVQYRAVHRENMMLADRTFWENVKDII